MLAEAAASPCPPGPVAPRTPISISMVRLTAAQGTCAADALRHARDSTQVLRRDVAALGRSVVDEDVERSRAPWSLRLVGLAVVIVVAWVVIFPLLNIAASLLALALYVIIGSSRTRSGRPSAGRATRAH